MLFRTKENLLKKILCLYRGKIRFFSFSSWSDGAQGVCWGARCSKIQNNNFVPKSSLMSSLAVTQPLSPFEQYSGCYSLFTVARSFEVLSKYIEIEKVLSKESPVSFFFDMCYHIVWTPSDVQLGLQTVLYEKYTKILTIHLRNSF